MKIFLATAKLDDVRWASELGLVDGVSTTPSLLASEAHEGDPRELLAEICRLTPGPVVAAVGAFSSADLYRDAKELAKISDNVTVQVPLVEDAVGVLRRLSLEGVRVAAALVYTAAQAILAAKAGATTVSTSVDQLDAHGYDSMSVLEEIRSVFDGNDAECDVMASNPQTATQFARCALAGADIVVVSTPVLKSLLLHPLTDRGLDQFLADVARHRTRPAT